MKLEDKHPYYEKYISRWNYYNTSFKGGEDYRLSHLGLLRKYLFEEDAPGDQYGQRLEYTALDNLVKLVIDTYRSFLFRNTPVRTFGDLQDNIIVQRFLADIDFEEQNLNEFMRSANDAAMIYGHVWIMVTKGWQEGVSTVEQEIANDIRPYAKLFTPENVIDWKFRKETNGSEKLSYLKTQEEVTIDITRYIVWTEEEIFTYEVNSEKETTELIDTQKNDIGEIPFVILKANRGPVKGIGRSDIADVAKIQQAVFNLLSESEQGIRVSNHPTLVKTEETSAMAGAGAVINMNDQTDPALKPYLIEPSGTNISSIMTMINAHIEAMLRMTHLGAIMAAKGLSVKSGIALATEFEMLNTRLADKSSKLEQAEQNVWRLFWKYSGLAEPKEFNVMYHKSFDLRDQHADLALYAQALSLNVPSATFRKELYKQIAKITIVSGDSIDDIDLEIDATEVKTDDIE